MYYNKSTRYNRYHAQVSEGKLHGIEVGTYDAGALKLSKDSIQWPGGKSHAVLSTLDMQSARLERSSQSKVSGQCTWKSLYNLQKASNFTKSTSNLLVLLFELPRTGRTHSSL